MTPEQAKKLSAAEQHEWFRRVTSRRALLRGGALGAGALIAGPALLGGSAEAATRTRAATRPARRGAPALLTRADTSNGSVVPTVGRHVMFGADPTTQMSVSWQTLAPVKNPFLRIGTGPHDLGPRIAADVRTLTTPTSDITPIDSVPPSAPDTVTQYYVHAVADKLDPGKTYYYSVGNAQSDPAAAVAVGSFSTAPTTTGPFTFTAFGDQGSTYDALGNSALIRAQNPAFHLHAGDCSYAEDGGDGLVTDPYDPRVWDSFFTTNEPTAGVVPWQVAVGNHEMEVWYSPDAYGGQYARWEFPGAPTSDTPPTYYSFVYGNVGVVALDPNDVSYEIPANFGYTKGAQTTWLGNTLKSLRANAKVDFIVVYFHHCAYSTCTAHASEGGVRQYWTPLFDQYNVDLVINGHNHIYERTEPIRAGKGTGAKPIGSTISAAKSGTTYITAGGGGESLYSFPAADSYEGHITNVGPIKTYVNESGGTQTDQTVNWSQIRYTGYCLVVVDSVPATSGGTSELHVHGLSETGAELDRFTLTS